MKKIISIGLIFALSAPCLYKLGVITYFQLNRAYIAEVLCINKESKEEPITMCYGKCFVDRSLKAVGETEKSSAPATGNEKLEISVFVVSQSSYSFYSKAYDVTACTGYLWSVPDQLRNNIFHPPAKV